MDTLLREVRQAWRALWAQPWWTLSAIVCLAIGTGANTATFSLVNGILLRPLPFDEPDRIVMVAVRWANERQAGPVSVAQFRDLRSAATQFENLSIRTFLPVGLAAEGPARMVQAEFVGNEYFDAFRVRPLIGRFFSRDSGQTGRAMEAVISERIWRSRFNSDPAIAGRAVRVNGRPVVVAGVAPAGFVGVMRIIAADLWMSADAFGHFAAPESPSEAESQQVFGVVGRLKPDITIPQARSQFDSVLKEIDSTAGRDAAAPGCLIEQATGFGVPPGARSIVASGSALLFVLMGMLVAVAIANVAGLMLARAAGRQKETAVRLALGASRYRIARQILVECAVLSAVGAAAGAVIAAFLPSVVTGLGPNLPEHLSFAIDVRPDWRTGLYSAISAALIAALFGLAPIRQATRTSSELALRESTGNSRTRTTSRSLNAFVVGQVAVSTVLLVVAALLARTYLNTQSVDPGVDIRNTVAVSLDWDQSGADRASGQQFYEQLVSHVATLPGVQRAALSEQTPLSPGGVSLTVSAGEAGSFAAGRTVITPDYFDVVRLPVLQGRAFGASDRGGHPVAIVNETMARKLAPHGSAIGAIVALGGSPGRRLEVVGVVRDAKYRSLKEPATPMLYEPFAQTFSSRMTLLARTAGDPGSLIVPIRQEVERRNPNLAAITIRTLEDQFQEAVAPSLQRALVLAIVCGLGLLLSAFGLFGVMSYSTRRRTRELGIRMAVGARPADIAGLVLRQAIRLAGVGLAIGMLLAFGATRILTNVLFGVTAHDPVALALVVLVLAAVALAAAWLPMRWAVRVDPVQSIRAE